MRNWITGIKLTMNWSDNQSLWRRLTFILFRVKCQDSSYTASQQLLLAGSPAIVGGEPGGADLPRDGPAGEAEGLRQAVPPRGHQHRPGQGDGGAAQTSC